MNGALQRIRVLDLSRALAGPFAAMTLGDFGADVIKIEQPRNGDTTRGFPPFWNGHGTYFLSTNRNKRGLTLDISTLAGQTAFKHLVDGADVVVESFRLARWSGGTAVGRISGNAIHA